MEELDRIREYFEGRADASCEPGDDRFRGNEEMSLLRDVEAVARGLSDVTKSRDELLRELKAMVERFSGYQGMELMDAKTAIANAEAPK